MKSPLNPLDRPLAQEYEAVLRSCLDGDGNGALHDANALGRRALDEGLDVLDVVRLHHEALLNVSSPALPRSAWVRTVKTAERLLVESLRPFARAHRGYPPEQALHHVNERLEEGIKRIAHALHDEAGQLLAAVYLAVAEIAAGLPPDQRERLDRISGPLDHAAEQLRRLAHELRPVILDDLGLLPAFEFLAQGMSKRTGLTITIEGSIEGRLAPGVETALYRVLQEALTNAGKHARATHLTVHVRPEGPMIGCTIQDNGVGFDLAARRTQRDNPCLGLNGMRERLAALGGTLSIITGPGHGTTLEVRVPREA